MISNEVFVASLNCRRKAFFKQTGQVGEVAAIERVLLQLDQTYTRTTLDWFLTQHGEGEVQRDPPILETAIQSGARFIVGATAQAGNSNSRLDLLERVDDGAGKAPFYAPVLFVRNNKVTKSDKLLLAFQAHHLDWEFFERFYRPEALGHRSVPRRSGSGHTGESPRGNVKV